MAPSSSDDGIYLAPRKTVQQLLELYYLADFTLTFGKFQDKKFCEVPVWYLQWLTNFIADPYPYLSATLEDALDDCILMDEGMPVDWKPPSISTAPDKFHQVRKLMEGERKSMDTALRIGEIDTMVYFSLSEQILKTIKAEELRSATPLQTNVAWYSLYHIWDLAKVYMTEGEADTALNNFLNKSLAHPLPWKEANDVPSVRRTARFQEGHDSEVNTSARLENASSGVDTRSNFLSENNLQAVKNMFEKHYPTATQEDFEWVLDLSEAGYSGEAILNALLESTQSGPWTISDPDKSRKFANTDSDHVDLFAEKVLPNFHQPRCVHKSPHCADSVAVPDDFSKESVCQSPLSFEKIESIRAEVAELCGVAGVYPPLHNASPDHHANFEETSVRIEYGPLPWSSLHINLDQALLPGQTTAFLLRTTRRLCKALRLLQESGLCCDKLTILVERAVLDQVVVCMVPIAVEDVAAFHVTALELYKQHKIASNSGDGQPNVDIALSVNSELHRQLSTCWFKARSLLSELSYLESPRDRTVLDWNILLQLHECVLTCQLLAVAVVSYAQAHTGDFHPHTLKDPIRKLILQGYTGYERWPFEKATIELSYKQLACMGDLVGGDVIVLRMLSELPVGPLPFGSDDIESKGEEERPVGPSGSFFVGSIEDIVDSWGPGALISDCEPGVPYGARIKSVLIGSGAITPVPNTLSDSPRPLYHFGRSNDLADVTMTFNIWDQLTIGAISVQMSCPLNPVKCRKSSEPYLDTLGTYDDYWKLSERQMMFQAGQYVGLQVGNVYSKVKGRPLKTTILEMWRLVHDFRILLQPWGLQVSLCTGVARRVPFRELIEEPMFQYIDRLSLPGWDGIKAAIRTAFRGPVDEYIKWTTRLQGDPRDCVLKVITFFLEVLKDTGVDREGKRLRLLWPDESSLSLAISLKCDKSNLWARVLQDSPSCATFAALTSTCLEAPRHNCKKNLAPTWTGQGALLSTAVCRALVPGDLGVLGMGTNQWELQNGQRCWIGKPGSEVWVSTSKTPNSEAQLTVKINRFPRGLSILRDWQVLRERQDATFEAEEVVVYGTMA